MVVAAGNLQLRRARMMGQCPQWRYEEILWEDCCVVYQVGPGP